MIMNPHNSDNTSFNMMYIRISFNKLNEYVCLEGIVFGLNLEASESEYKKVNLQTLFTLKTYKSLKEARNVFNTLCTR